MRLDKFLSNSTDYSRSQIKKLVRQQQVLVNGDIISNPAIDVNEDDQILLDGQAIETPVTRYFMLHKPAGVVSVTRDCEHTTAIDLLDEVRPELLQIAGRLDIDATGLLLITDDGQWNHRITSPQRECFKSYLVTLAQPVDSVDQRHWVEKCDRGIWLDREKRRTLPARLCFVDEFNIRLKISEGKYHQVKRMIAALGNRVVSLHRERIGGIILDPNLNPGEYRALTANEIESAL